MDDMQKSMKYSIIFGMAGAVLLPVIYEIYANISHGFALVCWIAWSFYGGIKFSSQKIKNSFLGITCTIVYNMVFGILCYMVIHPVIKNFLTKRSVYFQLSLKEQGNFLLWTILILLIMYLICIFRFALKSTILKLKSNGEAAESYIDNAFLEDKEGETDK